MAIIERKAPKRIVTYVQVGFRIYCRDGETSNKKDEDDQFFHGYGERSDKDVPLFDPSLEAAVEARLKRYHKQPEGAKEDNEE